MLAGLGHWTKRLGVCALILCGLRRLLDLLVRTEVIGIVSVLAALGNSDAICLKLITDELPSLVTQGQLLSLGEVRKSRCSSGCLSWH